MELNFEFIYINFYLLYNLLCDIYNTSIAPFAISITIINNIITVITRLLYRNIRCQFKYREKSTLFKKLFTKYTTCIILT